MTLLDRLSIAFETLSNKQHYAMSAIGTKRTSQVAPHMSAIGGKAFMTFALHMSAYDPKRTLTTAALQQVM